MEKGRSNRRPLVGKEYQRRREKKFLDGKKGKCVKEKLAGIKAMRGIIGSCRGRVIVIQNDRV